MRDLRYMLHDQFGAEFADVLAVSTSSKSPCHAAVLAFSLMISVDLPAQQAPIRFESGDRQTHLVELFTSEGCSSCPPAEAWFSQLKAASGLWSQFVPVAFHVDYWDHLGWPDPWASTRFTDRQRSYAQSWLMESIYTPGFVLDGNEWTSWRRARTVPATGTADAGKLALSSPDAQHWKITFAPAVEAASRYRCNAALLYSGLVSNVKAGENKGRRLDHDFVVIAFVEAVLKPSASSWEGEVVLKVPQDEKHRPAGRLAVAVWITRTNALKPVQATGGWIDRGEPKP